MNSHKIVAHTLVKNEQRWIWYALQSALDFVDEIMVWDTGSSDDTVPLIKSIDSPKIKFRQIEVTTPEGHTAARQQMLDATKADWILILDGDEIWWKDSLNTCVTAINNQPDLAAIISPFINVVGDIYHFQPSQSSRYQIGSHKGAFNLRFINRKISGLHVANPHGRQEYRDNTETPLQQFDDQKLLFVDKPYLHTTHLLRSGTRQNDKTTLKRGFKYRYELGRPFPANFTYPEALYLPRPKHIPDPFTRRSLGYSATSLSYVPARFIKGLLSPGHTSGY